jgi:hypothetical protein
MQSASAASNAKSNMLNMFLISVFIVRQRPVVYKYIAKIQKEFEKASIF